MIVALALRMAATRALTGQTIAGVNVHDSAIGSIERVGLMKDRITPLTLGFSLIRMYFQGWKSRPGYSVTQTENDGSRYVAMWLDRKP